MNSIKFGAERIRDLVISLRNFSHLDEADVKPVNLHEIIDSSILILHTCIKEKSDRSQIEIVRNYGNLPQVICQISQIHQVFMNLLINGIDALETMRDKQQEYNRKPTITISTEVTDSETVKIKIHDNGIGINSQTLSKIFEKVMFDQVTGYAEGFLSILEPKFPSKYSFFW